MTDVIIQAIPELGAGDAPASYTSQAWPILERHGGVLVRRITPTKSIAGKLPEEVFIVAAFPTAEDAEAAFESADYRQLIEVRDRAFRKITISFQE